MNRSRLTIVLIFGAATLAAAALVVVSLMAGDPHAASRAPSGPAIGTALREPRPAPPLELVDEAGRPRSIASFRGHWLVLAPSMTLCHEVCPMTTSVLSELTRRLAKAGLAGRVSVAEATVDPWRDSPARLRAYKRLTGADFTMLTGDQSQISRLWRFFGVYYKRVPEGRPADIDWMTGRPETFDVDHSDDVFIVDPEGRERLVDEGMPQVRGALSAALRRMLDAEGRHNLAHPQAPWTAAEVVQDLRFLMSPPA